MKQSKLIQFLFEIAIGTRKIAIPASQRIAYRLYYRLTLKKGYNEKYLIGEKIGKNELLLPLSHRLPWTLRKTPNYSRNLGRINKYIADHLQDYTIIDIGANIGDSAFMLRESDNLNKIICVEGNSDYIPLLEQNLKQLKNVIIIKSFVGQESGDKRGELVSDGRGTTHVKESGSGMLIKYKSLKDIVNEIQITGEIRLLKIDTDGYDCQIIKGNIEAIKEYKPVIFFEYAPSWFPDGPDSQLDIFSYLVDQEYIYFIFYDGYGDYMISCDSSDIEKISKEMHFYYSCGSRFGDIVVFHKNDSKLFDYSLAEERLFFRNYFKQ